MEGLPTGLRRILADRHSPEAAALYKNLLGYIHARVRSLAARSLPLLRNEQRQEEICGEVLFQLMQGGLARFQGDTLPALYAYVRTATDRIARRAHARWAREAAMVHELPKQAFQGVLNGNGPLAPRVEVQVASPLPPGDQSFLRELLHAGSQAQLARERQCSRAAVSQRLKRIRQRLEGMGPHANQAHEAWLHHEAQQAVG